MREQFTHCAINQGLAFSELLDDNEQMLNVRERRAAESRAELLELLDEFGRARAAEFLDVYESTIERWADGTSRVPRAALIALRAGARGQLPGMERRDWQGWYMGTDGYLYNPNRHDRYGPAELYAIHWNAQRIQALESRVASLTALVESLSRPAATGVPSAANDAA